MAQITVGLGERSYPIRIEAGCLDTIGSQIASMAIGNRYAIIADNYVAELYGKRLQESLEKSGVSYELFTFPRGEMSKTLATMGLLASQMATARFDRKDAIIALGGGVTGDIAGYLASSYMRGIPFVQIPTTLLAQVDSSVGGKTGVDLPEGKNLMGAFYQPQAVFIDPEVLATLESDELLGGLAEVIKYGVIWDEAFFEFLKANREKILALDPIFIEETISICCRAKAEVVALDEREGNLRKILNYGHTIGHAIEAESHFSLIHGLAVAIGMKLVADLGVKEGVLAQRDAIRIEEILVEYGMPITIPQEYNKENILSYLEVDKKVEAGKIVFVLPDRIGHTIVTSDVARENIEAVVG